MQNEIQTESHEKKGNYGVFLLMVGVSMVLMWFITYLNSYNIRDHFWFSETRLYMTLIMGSVMALVMLFFMRKMYRNKAANIAIIIGAVALFAGALFLVRSQVTVTGVDYMEAMIPHHSIAILTSERAQIKDPRVRKLADDIIDAQVREIKEMEWLIQDIRENGAATTEAEAAARPVPDFSATAE